MSKALILKIVFIFLLSLSGFFIVVGANQYHDWGDDFAAYIMQAKSIVDSSPNEYVASAQMSIDLSSCTLGPVAYPWGYPLLLSTVYKFFGINTLAFKFVGITAYILFLILFWFTFRKHHTSLGFLFLFGLFAFNPILISSTNKILSDTTFLFFSTLSIFLIRDIINKGARAVINEYILVTLTIAFSFMIRTNGILLLFSLVLAKTISCYNFSKSNRQEKADRENLFSCFKPIFTTLIFFLIVVSMWRFILPQGGSSHAVFLKDITFGGALEHLHKYIYNIPAKFFTGTPFANTIYIITVPLAFWGIVLRIKKDFVLIIYIALTLLLYTLWPPVQGIRFLYPILPLYISFSITGFEKSAYFISKAGKYLKPVVYIPLIYIIYRFFVFDINYALNNGYPETSGPFSDHSKQLYSYIINNTGNDDNIGFFKPRALMLFTGRNAVAISTIDELENFDYLCVYLQPGALCQLSNSEVRILLNDGRLVENFQNNDFILYKIK